MNAASPATLALMEAKLEASGLTMDDAILLGIDPFDDLAVLDPAFDKMPGMRFSYTDPFGNPTAAQPGWDPFYRVRRLDPPKESRTGFDAQTTGKSTKKKRDLKYNQPAGTGSLPYFPQIIDWSDVIADPDGDNSSIVITEGELKAAKACKEGFNCIGLGGIWSFKSAAQALQFLPGLDDVVWKRRRVYIVFDADMKDNPDGGRAINALAEELHQRGAIPYHIFLPAVIGDDGEPIKTGLDDYLLKFGAESFRMLCISCTHPHGIAKELWSWNKQFLHCINPACVVQRSTGQTWKRKAYTDTFPAKDTNFISLNSDNEFKLEKVSLATEIFNWPLHARVGRITYDPSQPPLELFEDEQGTAFNLWKGWGVEPAKGDVAPPLELIDHMFGQDTLEAKWLLAWLAYPLQHPGVKMSTAVLMLGGHGIGKSMLGKLMKRIYGDTSTTDNSSEVSSDQFFGAFNEWAAKKQFVLADEVVTPGRDYEHKKHMSAIKNFVTRETVTINEKYGLQYPLKDHTNIYMTANPLDSLTIENGERRYFIYASKARKIQVAMPGFLERWDAWKESGGPAAWFWYLLHEVDTSWFKPEDPAMETQGKRDVLENQDGDDALLVKEIMADGLTVGNIEYKSDLIVLQHLFALLNDDQKGWVRSPSQLQKALLKQGAVKLDGGTMDRRLKVAGTLLAFIAIRDTEKWATATPQAMRDYVMKNYPPELLGTMKKGKF